MQENMIGSKKRVFFRNKPWAGMLQRWMRLFVCLFVLWILMAYVAPWGRQTAIFRPMMDLVDERGIKVTSYYYTDSEDFAEAELNITHSLRFPPTGPPEK